MGEFALMILNRNNFFSVSGMRGADAQPGSLFSYIALEDRIPADLRSGVILTLINPLLVALSARFDEL